ncbi:hypothetical protein ABZ876_03690 [Streptomyces sp. NPDC046931]|uniref:hypothetical protein n=1 Tax=Streptomyces sp. NPDC046931 TaxID=3154806 RepID=UPI0033D41B11
MATPIEVHVPACARDGVAGADAGIGATVGGMPVMAAPGESVQQAVLNHLHRLALAAGHPVLAAVHDERIGYVMPVRVLVDGSSEFVEEPRRAGRPEAQDHIAAAVPAPAPVPAPSPASAPVSAKPPAAVEGSEPVSLSSVVEAPVSLGGAVAAFMLRTAPEQGPLISATSGPAQVWPGPDSVPPGTVQVPTGSFGPPTVAAGTAPVWPAPASGPDEPQTPGPDFEAGPGFGPRPGLEPGPNPYSTPEWKPTPAPRTVPGQEATEPPVREFAIAEAVLASDTEPVPPVSTGGPLAEPLALIGEAVIQGRIAEADGLAERTAAEASRALGGDHPDVLRLRELTAYIAYLADDPLRSFRLSLDLARLRHRLCEPRSAYGDVQSAAAAWRAVRDPLQGLHLGRDLIDVWSELAAGPGPAADDLDRLERARTRMGRLAERAGATTGGQPSRAR